jgi:hypothetical protein
MGTLMTLIFAIRCRHISMLPLAIRENPRNQSNLCSKPATHDMGTLMTLI